MTNCRYIRIPFSDSQMIEIQKRWLEEDEEPDTLNFENDMLSLIERNKSNSSVFDFDTVDQNNLKDGLYVFDEDEYGTQPYFVIFKGEVFFEVC